MSRWSVRSEQAPSAAFALAGLVLLLQNLATFASHYRGLVGIPWDFWLQHPRWSFWITAAQSGTLPEWNPYKGMGFPLALDLLADRYYPPFWLVVILDVPFTLRTAAVLQGLHVLVGALGMWALLRQTFPARWALVGACAFQLFGGFYSNAEHSDIVRGFCWLPWLTWATTLGSEPLLPRRAFALPLLIGLLGTGAYPGILIASLWLLPLYALAQTLPERRPRLALGLLALIALGLAMAAVHLGPAWLLRDQLARHAQASSLQHQGLAPVELLGLFTSSRRFTGEPSMNSTFVTLPIVFGIGLLTRFGLRAQLPRLVLLLAGLGMLLGESSPIRQLAYAIAPPLAYSVQVSSDYRGFVAIAVIALGLEGFRGVAQGRLSPRQAVARSGALLLLLGLGYAAYHWRIGFPTHARFPGTWPTPVPDSALALVTALAGISSGAVAWGLATGWSATRGAALLLLGVLVHGGITVADMGFCWRFPEIVRREILSSYDPRRTGAPVLPRPGPRPAREVPELFGDWAWASGVEGRYLMVDQGNAVLKARVAVQESGELSRYMASAWSPRLVVDASLPFTAGHPPAGAPGPGAVEQVSYASDEIHYQVRLKEPATLVENEIYFPGWSAVLDAGATRIRVEAHAVDGVLRAWSLPPGSYRMTARFETPWRREAALLSGAATGAWVYLVAVVSWIRRRPATADS